MIGDIAKEIKNRESGEDFICCFYLKPKIQGLKPGFVSPKNKPVILEEKCKRCMICWKFCPEPAISPTDPPEVDYDYCKGCGICITECPFDAIVSRSEGK